jgi:glyoxylate/hydroxypyruvate reductase A
MNTARREWVNPLDRFAIEPSGSTREASRRVDAFAGATFLIEDWPARRVGMNLAMATVRREWALAVARAAWQQTGPHPKRGMGNMALLLTPVSDPAAEWRRCFAAAMPELEVRVWPDMGDPAEIEVAAVSHLPPGTLAKLPNLRLIASLLAGQDGLLADTSIPRHVPILRTTNPEGDPMMNEAVLLHVLRHHRHLPQFQLAQQRGEWLSLPRLLPSERRVGVMGLGAIGLAAALMLRDHGFQVGAWARRPRAVEGVEVFHGRDQLPAFLGRSEILVNLLALTPETTDILGRAAFAQLPKGAHVINLARGQHVVDEDLVAALDEGQLAAATLDVFRTEPLPQSSPLWRHPRVTVIPHAARRIIAADVVPRICDNLRRLRRGEPLADLVDRDAGY